jgi:hypothetical protein
VRVVRVLDGTQDSDDARFQCAGGRAKTLVSFSCQRRRLCPSCCGRRPSAGAAELVGHILPYVHILLRPPLAQERLSHLPDDRVVCTLRSPWHDGTRQRSLQIPCDDN